MATKPKYDPTSSGRFAAQVKIRHLWLSSRVFYDLVLFFNEKVDLFGQIASIRVLGDQREGVKDTVAFVKFVFSESHDRVVRYFNFIEYYGKPVVFQTAGRTDQAFNYVDSYLYQAIKLRLPHKLSTFYPTQYTRYYPVDQPSTSTVVQNCRIMTSRGEHKISTETDSSTKDSFYICTRCYETGWLPKFDEHQANCAGPTKHAELGKMVFDHVKSRSEFESNASARGENFEPDLVLNICTERCAVCFFDFIKKINIKGSGSYRRVSSYMRHNF